MPFTTRMTVVLLSNGELLLHSPIRFDRALADELRGLGKIRHLVSPNQFHYAHIAEWARAFPDAITWASPGVRRRACARRANVMFVRDLGDKPPEEWEPDLDQTLFPGGYFKEFLFFHRASSTLIVTDAIINIELQKMPEPWRTATKISRMHAPRGGLFFGMRLPWLLHRRKAAAVRATLRQWNPQRLLLSHGKCFESGADEAVRRLFGG
nr:DUF4336 domain-containing protein [Sphingomonas sp. ID1715]